MAKGDVFLCGASELTVAATNAGHKRRREYLRKVEELIRTLKTVVLQETGGGIWNEFTPFSMVIRNPNYQELLKHLDQ